MPSPLSALLSIPPFKILATITCALTLFTAYTQADDVPVAPLQTQAALGYDKTYVLENDYLKVIIVPKIGRILYTSYQNSPNLLTQHNPNEKANYGGAWIWPMAKNQGPNLQTNNAPPPEIFEDRPWKSRAWKNADGTQNVLLIQEYDEPYNIKITSHIKLHKSDPTLHFKQRLDRFDAGTYPMTLWNLVQIDQPQELHFPTEHNVITGHINSNALIACENNLKINVKKQTNELKLTAAPQKPWCAILAQNHLLSFSSASPKNPKATYPNNGTATQIFLSKDNSYAQLELFSEERNLTPGEYIEQSFTLQITPQKPPKQQTTSAL